MAKVSHYPYIDSLRGLAFLGVLLIHVKQETPNLPPRLATAGAYGDTGVQLFFVISAFTLVTSWHKRKKEEVAPLSNYFIRRLARIAPLYWCCLIFYNLVNGTGKSQWMPNGLGFLDFVTSFTFTNGFSPYTFTGVVPGGWTISTEMIFYLLLPLLVIWVTSLPRAIAAAFGTFLGSLICSGLLAHFVAPYWVDEWQFPLWFFARAWFPEQLPIFLLGIVLFYLIKARSDSHIEPAKAKRISFFLLVLVCYIIFATTYSTGSPYLPAKFPFSCGFVLLALGLSLYPWQVIVNKVFCSIGTISFSCYLIHFFMLYNFTPLLIERMPFHHPVVLFCARYIVSLLCTIPVAALTYRFIELPGIELGRRLIAWNEHRVRKTLSDQPATVSETSW